MPAIFSRTWTFYQFVIGSLPQPGVLTNADVTITIPFPLPARVFNLKTNCLGQVTLSDAAIGGAYASPGKWISTGSGYVLDSSDSTRDGCCIGATGFHSLPPNQSGTGFGFLNANDNNIVIAYAKIPAVGNLTCAGISVVLIDGCGHTLSGTTNASGQVVIDGSGAVGICTILFDWSNVASAVVTKVPPRAAFITAASFLGSDRQVFPSIDARIYTDCLCGPAPSLLLDVNGLFGLGGTNTATNPSNFHDVSMGRYGRFAATPNGIAVWVSDFGTPPFKLQQQTVTTNGADLDPNGGYGLNGRLYCTYSRAGSTQETYSDDNGVTWIVAYQTIPGGTRPRLAFDPYIGDKLTVAYVGGILKGTFQQPGEATASAVFTLLDNSAAPLSVQNDTFDISKEPWPAGRWLLTCMIAGDTTPSEWASAGETTDDRPASWLRTT